MGTSLKNLILKQVEMYLGASHGALKERHGLHNNTLTLFFRDQIYRNKWGPYFGSSSLILGIFYIFLKGFAFFLKS